MTSEARLIEASDLLTSAMGLARQLAELGYPAASHHVLRAANELTREMLELTKDVALMV